jgi:hypothetical protein
MLRQDDYQKAQLVTVGWRYGQEYGGHLAACMVMSCLMNRVRLGWGTVLEVLDRIPNFAAEVEMPTGTPAIAAVDLDIVRLDATVGGKDDRAVAFGVAESDPFGEVDGDRIHRSQLTSFVSPFVSPPPKCMSINALADRQGFEPWIPCGIHAFQACAFSHSAICPLGR